MDDFSQLISKETKKQISSIKKYINKITHSKKLKKIKRNLKKNRHPKVNKIEAKDINRNMKNGISSNQKIIKKRNAGVDLLTLYIFSFSNIRYKTLKANSLVKK